MHCFGKMTRLNKLTLFPKHSNLKGVPRYAERLTNLDTILAEWKRSPILSSAMTLNRLFQSIQRKLLMNYMWMKLKKKKFETIPVPCEGRQH